MISKLEKRALQTAAIIGISAYPSVFIAFHSGLINFGKKNIVYDVPDEIVDMVESELDKLKNLLMKVDANIAVTDSLNPEWRGGFYFRNGFELLLPLRAVAHSLSELPKMKRIVSIKRNDIFSRVVMASIYSKKKFLDVTTDIGKHVFDDYFLSEAARRFLIRRELLRANSSAEYLDGARQYLNSSTITNLRIRDALNDLKSEFIVANGDDAGDLWPYSKRLKAIEKLAAEQSQKKSSTNRTSRFNA